MTTTHPTRPPDPPGTTVRVKRDGWVFTGLAAVALAAIVASFSTLAHLAETAGWEGFTSWLLPGCIDALALASGRVWLTGNATPAARRYARAVTLAAIAVSVVGNAVGHLLIAGYLTPDGAPGVVLVILVGSVPPAALGAVGHLAALAGTPPVLHSATTAAAGTAPATATGTETASRTETTTGTQTTSARQSRPTGKTGTGTKTGTRSGSGSGTKAGTKARAGARDVARAYWDTERFEGRTPSGAELARVADVDPSLGRRWRRDFETTDTATDAPATGQADAGDSSGVVTLAEGRAA